MSYDNPAVALELNPFDVLTEYELHNLIEHLIEAEHIREVHKILAQETTGGKNGWYEIKEHTDNIDSYVGDLLVALRLAKRRYISEEGSIGFQCRYSLILASLKHQAIKIPPLLMIALVNKGIWNHNRGFTYTVQLQNQVERVETMVMLAPYLPKPLWKDAINIILSIEDNPELPRLLSKLGSQTPTELLLEALGVARQTVKPRLWVKIFSATIHLLADPIKERMLRETWATVQINIHDWYWEDVIPELAPYLSESLLQEALIMAQGFSNPYNQIQTSMAVIPFLPPALRRTLVQEVLATLLNMKSDRLEFYVDDISKLGSDLSEIYLREMLVRVREFDNDYRKMSLISKLAPYLSELLMKEALLIAEELDDQFKVILWARLVPYLPQPTNKTILADAISILQELSATDLLWPIEELAPILSEPLLSLVFEVSQRITYSKDRHRALVRLFPKLPESLKEEAFQDIMTEADGIVELSLLQEASSEVGDQGLEGVKLIAAIIPFLSEPRLHKSLVIAQGINSNYHLVILLARIIPYLSEKLKEETLISAITKLNVIERESKRTDAINTLIPLLSNSMLRKILLIAQVIGDNGAHAKALARMVPWFAKIGNFDKAFEIIRQIKFDEDWESWEAWEAAFGGIVPFLSEPQLSDFLSLVQSFPAEGRRHGAMYKLAPYLPRSLVNEALIAAQAITHSEDRDWTISILIPQLSKLGAPMEALAMVQIIVSETVRATALRSIINYLHGPGLREALKLAQSIQKSKDDRDELLLSIACRLAELGKWDEGMNIVNSVGKQTEALVAFAPHLPEPLLHATLKEIQKTDYEWSRAKELATISPHLLDHLLQEALTIARSIKGPNSRAIALIGILPFLSNIEQEVVIKEAFFLIGKSADEKEQIYRIVELAPHLSDALLEEALLFAQQIGGAGKLSQIPELDYDATFLIGDRDGRHRAMSAVATQLTRLPVHIVQNLWNKWFEIKASYARDDLITDYVALIPVINQLGGNDAILELYKAIEDVERWWP
jgi:hypothetical protein